MKNHQRKSSLKLFSVLKPEISSLQSEVKKQTSDQIYAINT